MLYTSHHSWSVLELTGLIRDRLLPPTPPPGMRQIRPDPRFVIGFFEAVRDERPLGLVTLTHTADDRYAIIDGYARVHVIARVLLPELFDGGGGWPVTMMLPSSGDGRPARLVWGRSGDPAGFPLEAMCDPAKLAAWRHGLDRLPHHPDRPGHRERVEKEGCDASSMLNTRLAVALVGERGGDDVPAAELTRIRSDMNNAHPR